MKLLLLLSLASCTQLPLRERMLNTRHYQVSQIQIGIKCPNDHYYSYTDSMCHALYISATDNASGVSIDYTDIPARVVKVKPVKKAKRAIIDCKKVYQQVNQCMKG